MYVTTPRHYALSNKHRLLDHITGTAVRGGLLDSIYCNSARCQQSFNMSGGFQPISHSALKFISLYCTSLRATDLRWGEKFNKFLFHNSLLNIVVKKLRKSVNICQSYRKNKRVSFFMDHSVHKYISLHYINISSVSKVNKNRIKTSVKLYRQEARTSHNETLIQSPRG